MQHFLLQTGIKASFLPTSSEFQDKTGITSQSFRKSLISNGTYVHPVNDWKLEVDSDRMHKWATAFAEMKGNGVAVPLVTSHDARDDPDDFLGYVSDLYVDDGWLCGTVNVRGDRAIEQAQRVDQISVEIEKDFRDGKANSYGEAISRIALSPNPVVPNQRGFEATKTLTLRGTTHMFNKEDLQRLHGILGDEEITAENALDAIEARVKSLSSTTDYKEKYNASLRQIEELETKTLPTNSDEIIEDRADLYTERLSRLVESGQVTKGEADEWKGLIIGAEGKRNTLALSARDGEASFAKKVLSLLEDRSPVVEFGSRTKVQASVLDDKGRNGEVSLEDNAANKYMKQRIGIGV